MREDLHARIADLRERAARLPRVSLTELPTPLQACERLSRAIGHGLRLHLKRDDLTSLGFGGNKIRKLEFSLGAALAQGCDTVVHGLAGQSNYCRQTAAACAKLGLPCHLVLRRDHKTAGAPQGNLLLSHLFGARIEMVAPDEQPAAKQRLVERLKAQGRTPYLIGSQDEALGAVAYALCLAEILEQGLERGAEPGVVCVTGWNGTQAGLALGARVLGWRGRVLGFAPSPSADEARRREAAARAAREAARLLGGEESFSAGDIVNTSAYAGAAYGEATAEGLEALALLARTEGLVAGPVYTGKGLAGLIDYVRKGEIAPGSVVVFVHTGGTPEVFAYHQEVSQAAVAPEHAT
ncbi:MAG: pyridoxal-phosphate dependent enzyme [Planctomycetota bacterium]|nr:pyridoxal-phosphate dependent enzyme [Planctomycetota bacterium]